MDLFDNKRSLDPNDQGDDFLEKFEDVITPEMEATIKKMYDEHPDLNPGNIQKNLDKDNLYTTGSAAYHSEEAWIQTYSGRRFNPTKPIAEAIVIQDIAHSLSMQCRFSGHVNKFYSVAQHCVGVSYLCDDADALWGLLHDATEAYLVDVPSPLKRSGHFDSFVNIEKTMQTAICKRFGLLDFEPPSVKKADKIMLATEARDLMNPLRDDWDEVYPPLPFKIVPLPPDQAHALFIKRFLELMGRPDYYIEYIAAKNKR